MVDIESLRKRYVALNGTRPTLASALSKTEALAGLPLPPDFRAIAAFSDGECPVNLRLPSGEQVRYAEDFYDFLRKRIAAHLA